MLMQGQLTDKVHEYPYFLFGPVESVFDFALFHPTVSRVTSSWGSTTKCHANTHVHPKFSSTTHRQPSYSSFLQTYTFLRIAYRFLLCGPGLGRGFPPVPLHQGVPITILPKIPIVDHLIDLKLVMSNRGHNVECWIEF